MATRALATFLDSDDEWMPSKLSFQRLVMERRCGDSALFGALAQ
jgi:hypothetical protein